ncbi:helix-turn-helix transcriptional regulator [Paludibacterium sp.]|uniref:helix-turn-helix transcriptional regulator n=1 Tax=Paludibacterium sp. TaxID=1917523 RepID=UPI0025D8E511|nr:helix-turn-helix transcriptional regulator [Paludibacterium sp.]MBV8648103.1 helix-turn-helix domain-containing protein [Paludibacterium sp.]
MEHCDDNPLGAYLRDRREKLDPAAFGYPPSRRRTPGLRREEVAQRANVSATWYTWLEQGRGGAPSAEVLERIARALMLSEAEREHLFLLALGRPPEVRYQTAEGVSPRLQRMLDALGACPAYIMTYTWDVVAWNRTAALVLTDYGQLEPKQRNILRLLFCHPHVRTKPRDWESMARFVVAAFRGDVVRAGAGGQVRELVDELSRSSPEFDAMWREHDVRSVYDERAKQIVHPQAGLIGLEYSAFAVNGRPDLCLVIFNPATAEDAERIQALLQPPRVGVQ